MGFATLNPSYDWGLEPNPSPNLQQQLLQDCLLEIIEADRLDGDVTFAADDMVAIVDFEAFGRLRREDIFRRLHDDGQAVDDHALGDQHVAHGTQTDNTLIVVAVAGDIDDLP